MFLHQRWIALALSLSICVCTAGTQTSDACGSPQYNVSTIHGLRSALSTGYDPLEAPYPPPIDVHVLLTIRNIYSIDTKAGAYWIDLTVTAKWFDCRLAYNDSGNPYLTFIAWDAPQVWLPAITPLEIRETLDQPPSLRVASWPSGLVYLRQGVTAKFACTMDLGPIPFDEQHCYWRAQPLWPQGVLRLAPWPNETQNGGYFGLEVALLTHREWTFSRMTTARVSLDDGGTDIKPFDVIQFEFTMHRKHYWYTVNCILPAMLMWVLSYASLWLPPEGAPARVALIVLPILILVTLTNRAFGYMPIISQSTWLTDYMFLLTVHCVAHLVEYVLLQFCLRLRKAKAEAAGAATAAEATKATDQAPAPQSPVEMDAVQLNQVNSEDIHLSFEPPRVSSPVDPPRVSLPVEAPQGVSDSGVLAGKPEVAAVQQKGLLERLVLMGCELDVLMRAASLVVFVFVTTGFYLTEWEHNPGV